MKQTQSIMGMPIIIEVVDDLLGLANLLTEAFDEFRRTDELFSTYRPSSEISQLNAGTLTTKTVSPIVRKVLGACEKLKLETHGYFDIYHNNSIDPSGYVKGWSIGCVADTLRAGGAKNFVVSAGGDIVCAGHRADGKTWSIGIANPARPEQSIKNLSLSDTSIATSALYERGEHIYNPVTGEAATDLVSVSVIGPDIVLADVYATTVFAMGLKGLHWIQDKPDYAAYIVTTDKQASFTPNLEQYIEV